jgi:hypothetical protein
LLASSKRKFTVFSSIWSNIQIKFVVIRNRKFCCWQTKKNRNHIFVPDYRELPMHEPELDTEVPRDPSQISLTLLAALDFFD